MKFRFLIVILFLLIISLWSSFYIATDWSNKRDVLATVKDFGWALKYADDSLKKDKEVLKAIGK